MVTSEDQTTQEVEEPLIKGKIESEKKASKPKKTVSRSKVKKLQDTVKKLEKEKAELYEKYLRSAAGFDNSKKLMLKEVDNRIRNIKETIILDVLPVLDDLERTIDAVPEKEKSNTTISGVEMIRDKMKQIFSKYGLEAIESIGKEFDVEIHEALMMIKSEDFPSNHVVREHQKGYRLNGRVIRHAKVAVNKNE